MQVKQLKFLIVTFIRRHKKDFLKFRMSFAIVPIIIGMVVVTCQMSLLKVHLTIFSSF